MAILPQYRRCLFCNELFLLTRIDKYFCCSKHKSAFHNAEYRDLNSLINATNQRIKDNDQILAESLSLSKVFPPQVSEEILNHYEFDHDTFTGTTLIIPDLRYINWNYHFGLIKHPLNSNYIIAVRSAYEIIIPDLHKNESLETWIKNYTDD